MLRFLAEVADPAQPPARLIEEYRGKRYFVVGVGGDGTVYNVQQMNDTARLIRTINNTMLKIIRESPTTALGERVDGLKVDTVILSRDFTAPGTGSSAETLKIYIPKDVAQQFANADITSQQLIDQSVVLLNDNRVQVTLSAGN